MARALAPAASELATDSFYSLNAEAGTALFSAPGPPLGQDNFYASEDGTLTDIGPVGEHADDTNQVIVPGEHVATADLSHVVYRSVSNISPLWGFDETSENAGDLYEYARGYPGVLMVGVEGGEGSHRLVSDCGTELPGENEEQTDGTLSETGQIVYFEVKGSAGCSKSGPAVRELWERVDGEFPDAHSVFVSSATAAACTTVVCEENASKANEAVSGRLPRFEGASASGERVVFADAQQLTDAATEGGGGEENLYLSECPGLCEDPGVERRLVDVSDPGVGVAPVVGGPRVRGVMAISSDGSHVYFVARGVLTAEPNLYGEEAKNEKENLYLYTEGHLVFIATLSASDLQGEQWNPAGSDLSANVTPGGGFLVFTDDRALTGDDTRGEGEAEGAAQVFEYDAGTRALTRVSVGAPGVYECPVNGQLEQGFDCDGNAGTGNAFVALAGRGGDFTGTATVRRDPTMSENGELVFFESPIALTPGALNDVSIDGTQNYPPSLKKYAQNVYEYYRGRVYLISDGKDVTERSYAVSEYAGQETPNGLIGVDASGANVFFSTFDSLAAEDTDTERDYYDAHSCSEERRGVEPCAAFVGEAAPCGEQSACQGAPTPGPVAGAPASEVFSGSGNLAAPAPVVVKRMVETRAEKLAKALKACHAKKNKRRRMVCEAGARRLYGPVAKKSVAKKGAAATRAGKRGK